MSPVLTHYQTYPELNDELQRQWALLDTHDSLTDYFKHFRTRGQMQAAARGFGARGDLVRIRRQRRRSAWPSSARDVGLKTFALSTYA